LFILFHGLVDLNGWEGIHVVALNFLGGGETSGLCEEHRAVGGIAYDGEPFFFILQSKLFYFNPNWSFGRLLNPSHFILGLFMTSQYFFQHLVEE
jgi:hypothetical protein